MVLPLSPQAKKLSVSDAAVAVNVSVTCSQGERPRRGIHERRNRIPSWTPDVLRRTPGFVLQWTAKLPLPQTDLPLLGRVASKPLLLPGRLPEAQVVILPRSDP